MQISFLLYKVSVVAQGKSQFIDIIHCNLTLYDLILYSSQTDPSSEDSIRKYRQKCPQNSQKQKMAPYIYRFVINKLFHIPYTLYICVCVCVPVPALCPEFPPSHGPVYKAARAAASSASTFALFFCSSITPPKPAILLLIGYFINLLDSMYFFISGSASNCFIKAFSLG